MTSKTRIRSAQGAELHADGLPVEIAPGTRRVQELDSRERAREAVEMPASLKEVLVDEDVEDEKSNKSIYELG